MEFDQEKAPGRDSSREKQRAGLNEKSDESFIEKVSLCKSSQVSRSHQDRVGPQATECGFEHLHFRGGRRVSTVGWKAGKLSL